MINACMHASLNLWHSIDYNISAFQDIYMRNMRLLQYNTMTYLCVYDIVVVVKVKEVCMSVS
jgi:hypothetical protein